MFSMGFRKNNTIANNSVNKSIPTNNSSSKSIPTHNYLNRYNMFDAVKNTKSCGHCGKK